MIKRFMAIDQCGETIHGLVHPRKDLEKILGGKAHKVRVYRNGKTYHVGYVIRKYWFTLYEVTPYEREDK
jgi:hypothetical protein